MSSHTNPIRAAAVLLPLAVLAWAALAATCYIIGAGTAAVIDIISRSL